jgi:DNA-binding NarL/FixJ family response regulator
MTKILFFLNAQTLIFLEKDQTTQAIIKALSQGDWQSFQPLEPLFPKDPAAVNVTRFGSWLVVSLPDSPAPYKEQHPAGVVLSPRQREVLNYLALGYTNKQIAHQLNLSRRTVNLHIAAIKQKLETQTSAQSVGRATALGYCRQVMRRRDGC